MEMTGERTFIAPRRLVWDALNDPEALREAIPGCKELNSDVDGGFAAKVAVKVGPVRATFSGTVALSDIVAPESCRIHGEGQGGIAGFAKGAATVELSSDPQGRTVLAYSVEAGVGGKLAQVGSRLIESTASRLAAQFFESFGEIVEARAANVVLTADIAGAPADNASCRNADSPAATPATGIGTGR